MYLLDFYSPCEEKMLEAEYIGIVTIQLIMLHLESLHAKNEFKPPSAKWLRQYCTEYDITHRDSNARRLI
jgi:hypothetical protein